MNIKERIKRLNVSAQKDVEDIIQTRNAKINKLKEEYNAQLRNELDSGLKSIEQSYLMGLITFQESLMQRSTLIHHIDREYYTID